MGDDNKDFYNQKFGINIAMVSQMQLIKILDRMIQLNINYPIDSPQKQKTYLDLVEQYLICAIPYLSPEDATKYEKKILGFGLNKRMSIKNGSQSLSYNFDPSLDKDLKKVMIELQQKLRRVFNKISDDDEEDDGL